MKWRRRLRRGAAVGWVVVAALLLAALWLATVRGVDRATSEAEDARLADRLEVARAFATTVEQWLAAGQREAADTAASLGAVSRAGAQAALHRALPQPAEFGRAAMLVSPSLTVLAATTPRSALVGFTVDPCVRVDAGGAGDGDTGFGALVQDAGQGGGPAVSGVFDAPGDCQPTMAVAQAGPSGVVVLFGDLADLGARVSAGGHLGDATRFLVVAPDGTALRPGEPPQPLPERRAGFVATAQGRPMVDRVGGGPGSAATVAAYAPATAGWGVLVEEDAAAFDVDPETRPAIVVAGALTVVFASVLVLLVLIDLPRRRAQRRADQAKQAFFSIVSHELRTPLTVIHGTVDTLAQRWDSIDEPARHQMVDGITPHVDRLGQVVERVLTAAHLQAGTHRRPLSQPCELEPVIQRVVDRLERGSPLHDFELDVAPEASWARADPEALGTALEQLVDNAAKYSPRGGTVRISTKRRWRRVEIAVDDEGVGLPADTEPLFEAFTQAEPVLRRVHAEGGVGVGLFIVRSLVEAMGGRVRAESRQPEGSRFVVSLKNAPSPSDTR